MKSVKDYPIKYGFGITSPTPPWSLAHPHLGVDRPTPMRTPLIINGVLVAYTGNTGGVAAHHHLQRVRDGKVINPGTGGFTLPEPVIVYEVDNKNDTNIGKALRVRDGKGDEWSHFHLDEILVAVGDIIKKEDKMITNDELNVLFRLYRGNSPTAAQRKMYVGKVKFEALQKQIEQGKVYKSRIQDAKNGTLNVRNHLPTAIRNVYKPPQSDTGKVEAFRSKVIDFVKKLKP